MTAAHYQGVDVDLLLVAAILHDIGKTEELAYERSFSYTAAGQLVGHIVMGVQLVSEKIRAVPGFPPKLKLPLEHMILSHHGSLEFGSPKVPLFPEAFCFIISTIWIRSLKQCGRRLSATGNRSNEFTGWISALERVVLKKDRFLHSAADPVPLPEPAATPAAPAGRTYRGGKA